MLTTYIKTVVEQLDERYGELSHKEFVEKLFSIGVVDHRLCKVLTIREFVEAKMRMDKKITKLAAMRQAAEHFACTYEYIRKCMYYYLDVNMK